MEGFEAPIDNGDGTYSGVDMLDVSGMTDAEGNPVTVANVTVTDTNGDGSGDAVLHFPHFGEGLTLTGVPVSAVSSPAQLVAMGVPDAGRNDIVEGTAGDDLIDADYEGDPEGDRVDANDAADASNDDVIEAGAGDDTVFAGLGADTVYGGDGHDRLFGGEGVTRLMAARATIRSRWPRVMWPMAATATSCSSLPIWVRRAKRP